MEVNEHPLMKKPDRAFLQAISEYTANDQIHLSYKDNEEAKELFTELLDEEKRYFVRQILPTFTQGETQDLIWRLVASGDQKSLDLISKYVDEFYTTILAEQSVIEKELQENKQRLLQLKAQSAKEASECEITDSS